MARQICVNKRVHSKFVCKLPSSYHSKFSFTLIERCQFHMAVKPLRKISPYLHDIFQFSRNVTGHLSRNINQLFVPRVFTNYGKQSFYYRRTVLWNHLISKLLFKFLIVIFVFASFVVCIVYILVFVNLLAVYVQGSTKNKLYRVDSLIKNYNYN